MGSLDGSYRPFKSQNGYSSMAPCMRSCDFDVGFNGCDAAKCWCTKGNLDLRINSMTRCASSSCTFANMNTATDLSSLSIMQVEYCGDKGFSPAGMTLPSTADATPTAVGSEAPTVGAGITTSNGGARQTGPASTSDSTLFTSSVNTPPPRTSAPSSSSSGGLSTTAAKAGISIGAAACVLIFCLIIVLLRRRRPKPTFQPQPQPMGQGPAPPYQPGPNMPPPSITPYQNGSPFSPPPQFAQPAPIHIPQQQKVVGGDVSPIDEKAGPLVSTTPVVRKEVPRKTSAISKDEISNAGTPVQSQAPQYGNAQRELELHGDVPLPRHEVGNDGQITNTVSARGMELDGQQQGPFHQYPQQGAGGPELDGRGMQQRFEMQGGQPQSQQRYEMPGQQQGQQGQQRYEMPGQYGYGHPNAPYEIGPGR